MLFNSVDFMIFFPIVIAIYFVIPKKIRMIWLLISSYYFYMSWNVVYSLLIGSSTVITYLCGVLLSTYKNGNVKKKKQITLIVCIVFNLGILALFKYADFVIESINILFSAIKMSSIEYRFNFLLPVGISFYTFQALGYVMDVYKGEVEAEKNIIKYALFVSFFPQLVAGPIERSKNLLNQMHHIEDVILWNAKRVTSGLILMLWGFFMKMVIADRVAILVDTVFNNYRMYGSVELIVAAIGFAIQIYCDFGSYSMIAIGAAKVMGFELMENFNAPYFANSIRDFWGRWHISLSTWFRDYLYIPLGGNRRGIARKYINVMIVFITSGLWHGANWTYVVWGAIHGLYQVIGDILKPCRNKIVKCIKINTDCFSWRLLKTLVTFWLICFAWIFFRADTITQAFRYIKRIIVRPNPWIFFNDGVYNLGLDRTEMNILIFSIVILLLVDLIRVYKGMMLDAFLVSQNIWFEWGILIGLFWMIFIFGEYGPTFDAKQFIYFQF